MNFIDFNKILFEIKDLGFDLNKVQFTENPTFIIDTDTKRVIENNNFLNKESAIVYARNISATCGQEYKNKETIFLLNKKENSIFWHVELINGIKCGIIRIKQFD